MTRKQSEGENADFRTLGEGYRLGKVPLNYRYMALHVDQLWGGGGGVWTGTYDCEV